MKTTVWTAILLVVLFFTPVYGQTELTEQQRIADLNQLASLYAKNYAPYEWKRDVVGFDLLRLNHWLQQVHKESDIDFEETLVGYVASLNDAHSFVSFPSSFTVSLPLTVNIYDGKVLIDSINRSLLPTASFPFVVGDELLAFDGTPVQDVIASFRKYVMVGNPRTTEHFAADQMMGRSQQFVPHLSDVPDSANLTIRLTATGGSSTYSIPWTKHGIPITSDGLVPSPGRQRFRESWQITGPDSGRSPGKSSLLRPWAARPVDDTLPPYMAALAPFMVASVPEDRVGVLNFSSRFPVYAPPPGFVLRRGASSSDFFLTGVFMASGLRIGLIRIPNMSPASVSTALQQLDSEIAFFNANTDGLIVDVTRNGGGLISFTESMLQRFIPTPFRTMGFEIRATQTWLTAAANGLTSAQLAGAPPEIVQNLQNIYDEIERAYHQERGRTAPLSFNATGSLTLNPSSNAYGKPLLVLADQFTASAGEMFTAVLQDNNRAPIFGIRTMGAGGSVVPFDTTVYTQGTAYVTAALANRGRLIVTREFPPTPYIENVGVRPDIVQNYMTQANLMTGGAPYVQAFTQAIVDLIHRSTP